MSLYITSLNSGSNGNCYYVGNDSEAILVDAGISCKEIEKRMQRLGLNINTVKAIFISHEHTDHIKGITTITKKLNVPVYITSPTLINSKLILDQSMIAPFIAHVPIAIGGLTITAFPKFHDACDPYSFIVSCNEIKVGIFTDIGKACKHTIHYFKQCNAAFLEANYDDEMLRNGSYPYHLKRRITGGMGHLSNQQALELFKAHKPSFMSHLVLSHLSYNNNCPVKVKDLFDANANGVNMIVASRFKETDLYYIHHSKSATLKRQTKSMSSPQLAFAFV